MIEIVEKNGRSRGRVRMHSRGGGGVSRELVIFMGYFTLSVHNMDTA